MRRRLRLVRCRQVRESKGTRWTVLWKKRYRSAALFVEIIFNLAKGRVNHWLSAVFDRQDFFLFAFISLLESFLGLRHWGFAGLRLHYAVHTDLLFDIPHDHSHSLFRLTLHLHASKWWGYSWCVSMMMMTIEKVVCWMRACFLRVSVLEHSVTSSSSM